MLNLRSNYALGKSDFVYQRYYPCLGVNWACMYKDLIADRGDEPFIINDLTSEVKRAKTSSSWGTSNWLA